MREGDYLTFGRDSHQPAAVGARSMRVPRAQLMAVADHFDTIRVLHLDFNPRYRTAAQTLERVQRYLWCRQNPKWRDDTSRLVVIRPLVAPVGQPVRASTDHEAIFELLYQVGREAAHG